MNSEKVTIFWFRRDLRIFDNASLFHALKEDAAVQPIFIFDSDILDKLPKKDARVSFIHQEICRLSQELTDKGAQLDVRYGKPIEIWKDLLGEYNIGQVYANRDYEPYALERDKAVFDLLAADDIKFSAYKDHVIFEKSEVVKSDGKPYTVFTPYSKVWKKKLDDSDLKPYPSDSIDHWHQKPIKIIPSLSSMGFEPSDVPFPSRKVDMGIVKNYHKQRDLPAKKGTSRLSLHLRFGTVSIRELATIALANNETYLNELIWRDFYITILWHFPKVVAHNFKAKYDHIVWRNNEQEFEKWCQGKTGYPIVDAGMRELNEPGFMHTRVRMIVASFLTKHLLIDWQWGATYFAEKLLDFELASNTGGWQWAAGTGVDAAPYFRVFNPYLQTDKFDSEYKYIKKWVKDFDTQSYPKPIVDHKMARLRALDTYKKGLDEAML
jgi:deoxyribodipyrimidine photo-lyase